MQLTSSSFQAGGAIPARFTCEGADLSPELSWSDAPVETKSLVLILHDPDAPKANGFTHWVVYNIPSSLDSIPENVPKQPTVPSVGLQGKNDSGKIGYVGPCPPSGTHHYLFRLYALRKELDLAPGAAWAEVEDAMNGYVIEEAELMGTYARKGRMTA